MVAWKTEVHFTKSVKSPDSKSRLKATVIFIDDFHIFMGSWRESAVGMVYCCQSSPKMQYG